MCSWCLAGNTAVVWNFNAAGCLERRLGMFSEVKGEHFHVLYQSRISVDRRRRIWPVWPGYSADNIDQSVKYLHRKMLWADYSYHSSLFLLREPVIAMVMCAPASPSLPAACLTFMGLKSSEWWSASVWNSKLHRFNWGESSPWVYCRSRRASLEQNSMLYIHIKKKKNRNMGALSSLWCRY